MRLLPVPRDGDVQLAILIASAFSMYNRLVDGYRARTPADIDVYRDRAAQIADHGYSAPPAPPAPVAVEASGAD